MYLLINLQNMDIFDKLCHFVWNLYEVLFQEHDYPEWVMKTYTKDKDFLQLPEKDMRSFQFPFCVPTLNKTEEIKMHFRSKVININPTFAWITYFCRSHFEDETGIDPFGKKSDRNNELYELNKKIYALEWR